MTSANTEATSPSFPYECFVINLDRQPERLATFREWNAECGLNIERFPGIDGTTVNDPVRRSISTSRRLTDGAIGNSLSHKRLWERAVETFRPIVVLEDDAVLRSDIRGSLSSVIAGIRGFWDIILLGFNTNAVLRLRPGETLKTPLRFSPHPSTQELLDHRDTKAPTASFRLANAFGVCGYVVTPMGAKTLLRLCFPIDERPIFVPGLSKPLMATTIDTVMNRIYGSIDAYVCLPPLVMTPNDQVASGTLTSTRDKRDRKRR